jgi:hypothetical protein
VGVRTAGRTNSCDGRRSRAVRRLAGLAVPLLVLALAAPGPAEARDTSYCSPSGDICFGKVRGVRPVALQISMFDKCFSRYTLCVNRTGHARVCKSFRIRKMGEFYGSRVTWRHHFPNQAQGRYRARWRRSGGPLGPPIYFRA